MKAQTRFYYRDATTPEPISARRLGVMALIERDGSLLLERRADAPLWSLIAGGVEDAETLAEALQRDVFDETGLVVVGYDLFGTFSDPTRVIHYPDGNVIRIASFAYTVDVASFDGLRASGSRSAERLRAGCSRACGAGPSGAWCGGRAAP